MKARATEPRKRWQKKVKYYCTISHAKNTTLSKRANKYIHYVLERGIQRLMLAKERKRTAETILRTTPPISPKGFVRFLLTSSHFLVSSASPLPFCVPLVQQVHQMWSCKPLLCLNTLSLVLDCIPWRWWGQCWIWWQ